MGFIATPQKQGHALLERFHCLGAVCQRYKNIDVRFLHGGLPKACGVGLPGRGLDPGGPVGFAVVAGVNESERASHVELSGVARHNGKAVLEPFTRHALLR